VPTRQQFLAFTAVALGLNLAILLVAATLPGRSLAYFVPTRVSFAELAMMVTPTPSPSPLPTETPLPPTETPLPPTPTPLPPTSTPMPGVNGIPYDSIIVMPDNVKANIQAIYANGLAMGRNPHAFTKIGDSTIEYPYFMARFDQPDGYKLGDYAYLQDVISFYAGSFDRESAAVRRGQRPSTTLNPLWANASFCYSAETPVACEFRIEQPSIVFIRLGSNEINQQAFETYYRQLVEVCIANGVVPILGTKADRIEGPDNTINNVIRQVAADYAVPLWDFDLVAGTIPNHGVGRDGVHLTSYYSHDYTSPEAFTRGYGVHNLTALMALDAVWKVLNTP
jgi:hypothetical protein